MFFPYEDYSGNTFAPFSDDSSDPPVRGFLHTPRDANGNGVILTHGAGSNCQSKLLVQVASELTKIGYIVLRFDLPFRIARPSGPPQFGAAARDQQGIRSAANALRSKLPPHRNVEDPGSLYLGGHSYGGRQASMLLADDANVGDGLLLLSYPLHPPDKPAELRTQHFPKITKPCYFVHGSIDPFATTAELKSAMKLIPAPTAVLDLPGSAHELIVKNPEADIPADIAQSFERFLARLWRSGHHVA
jgi:uncharacterized protein